MKVLCILNPKAADGLSVRSWPRIVALLKALPLDYDLLSIADGPMIEQVASHLETLDPGAYTAIAGIGGDGTHSALLNALMRYQGRHPHVKIPPYAFIPCGTGNDIAQSLGICSRENHIDRELRRAITTILHGADYHLDMGLLNGRYFADAMTIGLDSYILRERNRQHRWIHRTPILKHLIRGNLLYTLSTGRPFMNYRCLQTRIEADGALWYEGPCLNIVINNTRIYAGVFNFSDQAFSNDGVLDMVLFKEHTDYLSRYLVSMHYNPQRIRRWSNKLTSVSTQVQAKQFKIVMARPESAQVDGEEIAPAATFTIDVIPRAIHIKTAVEPIER